ncbi:unnamed protein product [Onchocerca flexuosa]|uniref:Cystatin domain-containing protein n=1 Tax=Onchocerca flexuosa TaxID=387005 RepID=A0A183HMD2_9BILA|nr:unnamed protein product [Onchocerca flexuosa]
MCEKKILPRNTESYVMESEPTSNEVIKSEVHAAFTVIRALHDNTCNPKLIRCKIDKMHVQSNVTATIATVYAFACNQRPSKPSILVYTFHPSFPLFLSLSPPICVYSSMHLFLSFSVCNCVCTRASIVT